MCKLSLWLVSLDRDLPFSFVDDKIFHGNSLLGLTDLRQLRALHIDPPSEPSSLDSSAPTSTPSSATPSTCAAPGHRDRRVRPARSTAAKHRQLDRCTSSPHQLTASGRRRHRRRLRLGGKPGKALNEAYENLRVAVSRGDSTRRLGSRRVAARSTIVDRGLTPDRADRLRALAAAALGPRSPRRHRRPRRLRRHHRQPAVPRRQKLTGAMGTNVRDWFVDQLADGARGNADLVAYFLLRASRYCARPARSGLSPPTPSPRATPARSASTRSSRAGSR